MKRVKKELKKEIRVGTFDSAEQEVLQGHDL